MKSHRLLVGFALSMLSVLNLGCVAPAAPQTPSSSPVASPAPTPSPEAMTVSFLDVGQGDAELIRTPHGKTILVDAGTPERCREVIEPHLKAMGIETIDLFVITHPHADHYGAPTLFTTVRVQRLWEPGVENPPVGFLSLLDGVSGFERWSPHAGDQTALDGTALEVLAPELPWLEGVNNASIVFRLAFGGRRFLFSGDAEIPSWERILARGEVKADVLKVSHHGSRNGTDARVLSAVAPEAAVISCGKDNSYGHPHAETTDFLKAAKVRIFRTDEEGTISCRTDGSSLSFSTSLHPSPEGILLPIPSPTPTVALRIGNKSSLLFHGTTCRYSGQISESNRVTFSSRAEAEAEGYRPCSVCGGN